MLKKYQHAGRKLSAGELQKLSAGFSGHDPKKLYHCTEGTLTGNYCSTYDPGPVCGFTCAVIGTCQVITFNGSNCF